MYGPIAYGAHNLSQEVGVYGQHQQVNNNNSNAYGETSQKSKFKMSSNYDQTSRKLSTSKELENFNVSFDDYETLDSVAVDTLKTPISVSKSSNELGPTYRAEYSFQASNNLELSVAEGERVRVVCCHDVEGNAEWWLVKTVDGSKQGYVPANYLAKVTWLADIGWITSGNTSWCRK